jgi:2-oxoglutarate/2-oxoacid ferredoxin oxidoreductase subunit beta
MTEPNSLPLLLPKDYESDQDIRWCPGCGDAAILKQVQNVLPSFGIPKEKTVFISGIGCSSRFPYYMNTYGMHAIHGRATAVATGLKLVRPDLNVWIITGDGDALSIGGNHLIHILRRDIDVNILLFNNQIYGLTKGQYSPTSEQHKITKSSPFGTVDKPFNPISLALGAGAGFIARTIDREAKHLQEMLKLAEAHNGASFVEIYQNCHIFNDNAFEAFTQRSTRKKATIFVEDGKPLVFGEQQEFGIQLDGHQPKIVEIKGDISVNDLWIHDQSDQIKANILSLFFDNESFPRPFGVLYQRHNAQPKYPSEITLKNVDKATFERLLRGKENWKVD